MQGNLGYWDPITATVDWCESNYVVTRYCAEFINAFTNIIFFYLGYHGIKQYWNDPLLLVSYIGYLTVGLGSFLFHGTLKYSMQLLDELPMIWTASILLYASLSRSVTQPKLLAYGIAAGAITLTLCYVYFNEPNILFISFALQSIAIMVINFRKHSKPSSDEKLVSRTKWLGLSLLIFGHECWMVDMFFCNTLQAWREGIGQPWASLLELHGWWHIAMGVSCHCAIMWIVRLENADKYRITWKVLPWLHESDIKSE